MYIREVRPDDWESVRVNFQRLGSAVFGSKASPIFAGLTLTGLTASTLIGADTTKALESVTIGTGLNYTRPTLSLSHLGIEALADPDADRILFWDESAPNACKWLACGNSIAITTTTLDTIQDIRTSASPTFVNLTLTGDLLVSDAHGVFSGEDSVDSALVLKAGSDAGGGVIDTVVLTLEGASENMVFMNTSGGTITFSPGNITTSTGTIDFDDENLTTDGDIDTTGTVGAAGFEVSSWGSLSTPIGDDDEILGITVGCDAGGEGWCTLALDGGIGGDSEGSMAFCNDAGSIMTFWPGHIEDSTGTIDFDDENLSTSGTLNAGITTLSGGLIFADPGTNSNSYKISLIADSGGTNQTSEILTCYGADPYLRLSAPNDAGAATAVLDIHDQIIAFSTDNATDIGASGANRPKNYYGSGTVTIAGALTASNYTAANLLTACATNAGALDFSAASKTLTVEDNAIVSQDYSSDASPTFAGLNLGTGELTCGSINRAADTLTLEIGGTAEVSITSTTVTLGGNLIIPDSGTIGSASDTNVMTIDASGNTTFSVFPITPSAAPDADYEVANKKYVDDNAGGVSTWIDLTDTDPANYTGDAGKAVVVNAGEDGLEFGPIPGGAYSSRVGVYLSSDQSITSGSFVKVALDTELFDGDGEFDNATHYRFTAGSSGYYVVTAGVTFDSVGTGKNIQMGVYKNGSTWIFAPLLSMANDSDFTIFGGKTIYLAATDYIELYAYQNSGSNKNILGYQHTTFLTVHRLS